MGGKVEVKLKKKNMKEPDEEGMRIKEECVQE